MGVRALVFLAGASLFGQTGPNVITTVAGNGASGFDVDTGRPGGGTIRFAGISSINRDSSGNWIVADYGNNRIRRLSPDFSVATTILGTGSWIGAQLTGRATGSSINSPVALAFADQKLLYVQSAAEIATVDLDSGEYNLRVGNGGRTTDGPALDASGEGTSLAVYPDGRVFFASPFISNTSAARVRVFDPVSRTVRNVTPNSASAPFKGGLHIVLSRDRVLYAIDGQAFTVSKVDPATGAVTPVLNFRDLGIKEVLNVVEGPGNTLFVADGESHRVFRLDLTASGSAAVQAIAGNGVRGTDGLGGPALEAQLAGPRGLYWDGISGFLYIGESQGSRLLFVDQDGVIKLAAGTAIPGYGGDATPGPLNALEARMGLGGGLTADDSGNLYTCEPGTSIIRRLTPATGALVHVAGHGLAGGLSSNLAVEAYIGDCIAHTFDPSTRSLYFIDSSNLLRRIDISSGTISTVSNAVFRSILASAKQIAVLRGNIVVADTSQLKTVTPQGNIAVIAGTGASTGGDPLADTPAAQAVLNFPGAVAAASDGTIYFTTNQGTIIRSLGTDGIIRHVGGTTTASNTGDGGPAKQATFGRINRLAVDSRKRIYVGIENMIRVIDEQGNVNRFAGGPNGGFSGDGGNPLGAMFRLVGAMTFDGSGTMFVGDVNNSRIRRIGQATTPSRFSIISGNGQAVDTGAISQPLTVEVRNANGQPVAGAVVNFSVENGSLSARTVTTNAAGIASVVVTAGPVPGPVRVSADSSGLGQLVFTLTSIPQLSITEVTPGNGVAGLLAPGSLARVRVENARGQDDSLSITFRGAAATVLEGRALNGAVLVAIPDTLDAGDVDVVASEAGRAASAPLSITLDVTAPRILDFEISQDLLICRVTGYGQSVDGLPVAASSARIDDIESDVVGLLVKSAGIAEMQIRIPAELLAAGSTERTLAVRIGGNQAEAKVLFGQ